MPNTIIGLDPGQSGGIAILAEGAAPVAHKMPETERDLYDLLAECRGAVAYLERVGPMPKQGLSSTWKFGQHYGSLRMALTALGIPFEAVAPGVWQRAMQCLSGGDKNVTKAAAQRLFPQLKITHAVADSLLLAAYGYRQRTGRPW